MLEAELQSPVTLEASMDRDLVRSEIKVDGEAVDKGFLRYKASNGAYETILPDGEVNGSSTNIVQNKAVHEYVEGRIADVEGDIPDVSDFVTKDVDNLTYYTNTTTLNRDFAKKSELPTVPEKTSDLLNDGDGTSSFATESYVATNGGKIDKIVFNGTEQTITNKTVSMSESDPTVPSWAKQLTKPSYDYSEINNTPTIDDALSNSSTNAVQNKVVNSAITNINVLIPSEATANNQLADKDFVNSSIATNTANFLGTFANLTELTQYIDYHNPGYPAIYTPPAVTNNDYAFVTNSLIQYNGGDFPDKATMDTYVEAHILNYTNYDYAWVVNGTKFDLYYLDILTDPETMVLKASNVSKDDVSIEIFYNRYKYNKSENSVIYEYTLNHSSFTARQWATINSGLTASDKTKLDGIASGAEVNVQADWSQSNSTQDDYIKNKPSVVTTNTEQTITGKKTFSEIIASQSIFKETPIVAYSGNLPSTYQEVEWIHSDGTQAIDTGVMGKSGYTIELDISFDELSTGSYQYPVGYAYTGSSDRLYYVRLNNNSNYLGYTYGSDNSGTSSLALLEANKFYHIKSEMKANLQRLYLDGTLIGSTTFSALSYDDQNAHNIYLFVANYVNSYNGWTKAKVKNVKIYDENNTLVRNFVPCYRVDNKVGLYDTVGNTFYTNITNSQTDFTAGASGIQVALKSDLQSIENDIDALDTAKQDTLPTSSTANKLVKTTSTAGTFALSDVIAEKELLITYEDETTETVRLVVYV